VTGDAVEADPGEAHDDLGLTVLRGDDDDLLVGPRDPREVVPPPGTTRTADLITKCGCRTGG
jgi:hypothetical protein